MENVNPANLHLLKAIVNDTPIPIAIYSGKQLEIVLANKRMIETYGKGEHVLGKSYMELLPELAGQGIFEQLWEVLETGKACHKTNKKVDIVINGALSAHYFDYDFTPVYDELGAVYAVMNTAVDVTHLHLAQKQADEATEKLRLAVESADLGIFEANLMTNEVKASARFSEIWGIDPSESHSHEELIGRIYLLDKEVREQAYATANETKHLVYEARVVHPDQSLRWLRVRGTLVPDETGRTKCILGIVQDITEHKTFAEKLKKIVKKRTKELKRSNKDLLQFAHVVSHDLKEPVRKIKIFNDLLKTELDPVLPVKGRLYIDKVQHASDRIFMMIDGILSYSAMNISGNPVENVNINAIIDSITIDLELVIAQKKAILSVEQIPNIEGSPILIHQLFYNLINNSLKFSRENIPPQISVKCIHTGNEIVVLVRDNGIGIDEKYSKQIFTAFQRLHSKDKYEGTGLGLSLCRKIVQRHHGNIEVVGNTAELDGTEFKITLPLLQPVKGKI